MFTYAALNKVAHLLLSRTRGCARRPGSLARVSGVRPWPLEPPGGKVQDQGCAVMAKTLLRQYWDIPEGTECHRKTYATTSIGGATGERLPGLQGIARREAVRSLGRPEGVLEGLRTSRGGSSRRWGVWGGLGTVGGSCTR